MFNSNRINMFSYLELIFFFFFIIIFLYFICLIKTKQHISLLLLLLFVCVCVCTSKKIKVKVKKKKIEEILNEIQMFDDVIADILNGFIFSLKTEHIKNFQVLFTCLIHFFEYTYVISSFFFSFVTKKDADRLIFFITKQCLITKQKFRKHETVKIYIYHIEIKTMIGFFFYGFSG